MKRLFGYFMLAFLTFQSAYAQPSVGLVLEGGLSNVTSSGELYSESEGIIGYGIGFLGSQALGEKFMLYPGIKFVRKGFNYNLAEAGGADIQKQFRLNYIEIPVQFGYKIEDFRILFGPYTAVGIFSSADLEDDTEFSLIPIVGKVEEDDIEDLNQFDNESYMSAIDYGAALGIGYHRNQFMASLNYYQGLNGIFPESEVAGFGVPEDETNLNYMIRLSVALFFR